MRIVLIAPSHWHYPMYRDGLCEAAQVVGVFDPHAEAAAAIAHSHGCTPWTALAPMLDATLPDFAFVFGTHAHMPSLAEALIARRIPFSIEKPCGTRTADVRRIRQLAEAAGVWVSVPFHYRISDMARHLQALAPLPSPDFLRWDIRINAGSPLRFVASSPWLTDPDLAGGGCMMNLAHHAIDWLLQCTGAQVRTVHAHASHKLLALPVEDQAVLALGLSDGTMATIATGYTHPASPGSYMDFDLAVEHRGFHAQRAGDQLAVTTRAGDRRLLPTDWTLKRYFALYASGCLERVANNAPPLAGLPDLEATVRVVEAGYRAIRTGAEQVLPDTPLIPETTQT